MDESEEDWGQKVDPDEGESMTKEQFYEWLECFKADDHIRKCTKHKKHEDHTNIKVV